MFRYTDEIYLPGGITWGIFLMSGKRSLQNDVSFNILRYNLAFKRNFRNNILTIIIYTTFTLLVNKI